ncbi:MAG: hypothetical protein GDA55_01120 [Cellvibrionales bacterium]|nr:hypothetical protein [Cellvibrionales bacterium]
MNTYQANYEAIVQTIRADMERRDADQAKRDTDQAKRDTAYREEAAKREADYRTEHQAAISALSEKMARRENRLLIALIAVVGIATAILGLMIQLT